MCRAVEECLERGRQTGIKEGIKEGEVVAIRNLMKNLHMTVEQAMETLEIDKSKREEYIELIKEK